MVIGAVGAVGCSGELGGDATTTAAFSSWSSRGVYVDPANGASRPCSDLGGSGLRAGGFIRMPVKFSSPDWNWQNGGFENYLSCVRATLPGVRIIGTVGEDTLNPVYGVPHNPYYTHQCSPNDLYMENCPQFNDWLNLYLQYISPTITSHFDIIEVYNEPDDKWNGSSFGSGTTSSMPPIAYAQLLNAFYDKFRGPLGKPIMMGGMDSGHASYLSQMWPYKSDYVNIHPYGSYPANTPGFYWNTSALSCSSVYGTLQPCFGSTESVINNYVNEFRNDGGSGALIITEWGTGNSSQAPGLIRAFFSDPTTSAQNAVFFAYSDANQNGYGLKDVYDNPKPAYWAFQNP